MCRRFIDVGMVSDSSKGSIIVLLSGYFRGLSDKKLKFFKIFVENCL